MASTVPTHGTVKDHTSINGVTWPPLLTTNSLDEKENDEREEERGKEKKSLKQGRVRERKDERKREEEDLSSSTNFEIDVVCRFYRLPPRKECSAERK